ncbi:hypothetical protein LTR95_009084 [Oleoguttula sp. CCFEE 5521]
MAFEIDCTARNSHHACLFGVGKTPSDASVTGPCRTMSLSTILYAYLIGGLTFLPLLVLAVVLPAWLTLPQTQEDAASTSRDERKTAKDKHDAEAQREDELSSYDSAASGNFAVLRSYNFQSALAALNAKSNTGPNGSEGSGENGSQESMSVYQSMYKSVFERNKATGQKSVLAEQDEVASAAAAAAKPSTTPATIYHIVLRHRHLMLYDSAAQLEVRHVIGLAHHNVSLTDGEDEDVALIDGDLFVKRTAICLQPNSTMPNGFNPHEHVQLPKPFYLFSATCSEKEDFYHALLSAQAEHPVPQPLDPTCTIKLQSALHSNSLTTESRALNALLGRVFLAVHRTTFMQDFIRKKIEKKIARVTKPAFIASIAVQSIDLGDMAPIISNLKLKDLNISGDMIIGADVKYTGAFKVVIAAVAKLDLGARFKVRTVDLVLAASLQRLQGKLLVRVKPSPSNRLWFCFEEMPAMEVKIEPVVSTRQITYTFILKAIENRIREVVAETLVKPNWDDVPFFDTSTQQYRGGIWQESKAEESDDDASSDESSKAKEKLGMKQDQTASMPVLPGIDQPEDRLASASSGVQAKSLRETSGLISRSTMSLPPPSQAAQVAADRATTFRPPKPMRSPSLNAPSPSVAMDGVSALKSEDLPRAPAKRWIGRAPPPAAKRDAVDAVREVYDRAGHRVEVAGTDAPDTHTNSMSNADHDSAFLDATEDGIEPRTPSRSGSQDGATASRNDSQSTLDTTDPASSAHSRASTMRSSASSSTSREQAQAKGKNLLAATAAATTAARAWAWNAAANRKKGAPIFQPRNSRGEADSLPQEPMGRGQPLPPPGTPLPKPPKGSLWGGSGFAGGSVKRKPVLPARRTGGESEGLGESSATASSESLAKASGEDEFGPWNENFEDHDGESPVASEGVEPAHEVELGNEDGAEPTKRQAPPLPPRRRKHTDSKPATPTHDIADSARERGHDDDANAAMDRQPEIRGATDGLDELTHPAVKDRPTVTDVHQEDLLDFDAPAAPAPADVAAEEQGSLEIEEGDGRHLINDEGDHIVASSKVPHERYGTAESSKAALPNVRDSFKESEGAVDGEKHA